MGSKKTDLRRGRMRKPGGLSGSAIPAPGSGMEDSAEEILFGNPPAHPAEGVNEEKDEGQQER